MLGFGAMFIVGGFGLFKKKRYGIVILYGATGIFLLISSFAVFGHFLRHSQSYVAAGAFLLYWLFPALFYYPKRWRDFS